MKVTKFGGSSCADATQIKKVCDILLSDPDRRVIVVSAPGKRFSSDIKVTDLLIALANAKISGQSGEKELKAVLDRFSSICDELDIPECMESIKESIEESTSQPVKDASLFMDATKALGEDSCARLVATYLTKTGHKATYCNPKVAGLLLETEVGGHVKVILQHIEDFDEKGSHELTFHLRNYRLNTADLNGNTGYRDTGITLDIFLDTFLDLTHRRRNFNIGIQDRAHIYADRIILRGKHSCACSLDADLSTLCGVQSNTLDRVNTDLNKTDIRLADTCLTESAVQEAVCNSNYTGNKYQKEHSEIDVLLHGIRNDIRQRRKEISEDTVICQCVKKKQRQNRKDRRISANASPCAMWQVGLPLLRQSSSMHGRSSWIREYVWTISMETAKSSTTERSRWSISATIYISTGRIRLPPARRLYIAALTVGSSASSSGKTARSSSSIRS